MSAPSSLPSVWIAALLLFARTFAERFDLVSPSTDAILTATGASKSRAYEIVARLATLLPTFVKGPGRSQRVASPATSDAPSITSAVLEYVLSHPGCAHQGADRHRYSDGFRRFVAALRSRHDAVDLDRFASLVLVPVGTLKDWLRAPPRVVAPPADDHLTSNDSVDDAHIQSVLEAWSRWEGTFVAFCEHVSRDLRLPFGRYLVRHILEALGVRSARRRDGRRPDELALKGAFRTHFPGAQWVGDGMQVPVVVDGQRFVFNLELDVDAYAGAFVGLSVRATEDCAAVVEAFESGIATTGARPLALLLDNKPSNHAPNVDAALGDTTRIRATPERPQNKAHVEGAFGLFSQVLPPLVLDTCSSAYDVARQFMGIVVTLWARTTNHRPRKDRRGRSRAELYGDAPTDEQIELAKRDLRDLAERQERARRTLEARRRPEVLALLDSEFARLGLLDPERHIRVAIAGYPLSAIVDGLLIFDTKRRTYTLPDGADARYLLGIVKNVSAETECMMLAETLYRGRLEMRDRLLAPLRAELEALRADTDVARVLTTCVERAVETPSAMERSFWLDATAETLRAQPDADRERLFLLASRLIAVTFALTPRERQDAIRHVADRLVPIS